MKKLSKKICTSAICAFVLLATNLVGQPGVDWQLIGNAAIAGNYFGTTNGIPLDIKTLLAQPIRFYTSNTQQATILANGHAGFGLGYTPGNDVIDILPDVGFPRTGYGINGNTVLHNYNSTTNIFVGVLSGQNISTGGNNSCLGINTGFNLTTESGNTFVGCEAGSSTPASINVGENTYIGCNAGKFADGGENVFVGVGSGAANTAGNNSFLGVSTGAYNTGAFCSFIGYEAGKNNTGNYNIFVGAGAGTVSNSGVYNCFMGISTGNINSTGSNNTFLGSQTASVNTTGELNTFIGASSGVANDDGRLNSFLGASSGITCISGGGNTLLGAGTLCASNAMNQNVFGVGAEAKVDNTMILGDNTVYVGIGLSSNATGPLGMLHIYNNNAYDPSSIGTSFGIYSINDATSTNASSVSGYFEAYGGTSKNYGIQGISTDNTSNLTNIGVYGGACGGNSANWYAGYFAAKHNNCSATASSTSIGVYADGDSWAAYFNGKGFISTGFWTPSDSILKTNVTSLTNGLQYIMQLQPKEYEFNQTLTNIKLNLPHEHQYGFMAQELNNVLPALVTSFTTQEEKDDAGNVLYTATDLKSVDYTPLITIIVSAIQEQQTQIYNQQITIDSLITAMGGGQLRSGGNTGGTLDKSDNQNNLKVELSDKDGLILDQNDPNPFFDQTIINYFIPDNITSAEMFFYDNNGKVLRKVEIKTTGSGSITVYGSQLKSGIYQYSLIAGGKIIESKKMVKQ